MSKIQNADVHPSVSSEARARNTASDIRIPSFGVCFGAGTSNFGFPCWRRGAFTLVELLIVISIIIILAGLTIATMGYVQDKGKRSRTEAEIAAISAALESYKADNGVYPKSADTDALDPADGSAGANYQKASQYLYGELSGDIDFKGGSDGTRKAYFGFKPQMLAGTKDSNGNLTSISYIQDPFGMSYGYSTMHQVNTNKGYNPTYDLWSTGGTGSNGTATDQSKWIKNW